MTGKLFVIGLGPGSPDQVTPEALAAVAEAAFFLRLQALPRPARPCARARSASRPTIARRFRAPQPRSERRPRARRSPSCPAATPASSPWRQPSARRSRPGRRHGARSTSRIVPGVTAMLAVAARIGAPLGHDFCAISLSDNLKPWDVIELRLIGRGGRRLRHRALQSDQQGAALAARPRLRLPARACCRQTPSSSSAAPPAGRTSASRRWRLSEADPCARRHGDLRHHRLAGDAGHRARREMPPLVYTPRSLRAGKPMIDHSAIASSTVSTVSTAGRIGRRNRMTSMPSARAAAILP